jgi:hypothetical protein
MERDQKYHASPIYEHIRTENFNTYDDYAIASLAVGITPSLRSLDQTM